MFAGAREWSCAVGAEHLAGGFETRPYKRFNQKDSTKKISTPSPQVALAQALTLALSRRERG